MVPSYAPHPEPFFWGGGGVAHSRKTHNKNENVQTVHLWNQKVQIFHPKEKITDNQPQIKRILVPS